MAEQMQQLWSVAKRVAFAIQIACLIIGGVLYALSEPEAAAWGWVAGTVLALAMLGIEILQNALRGDFALDLIAAVAMLGTLFLGEPLAGVIVGTMYLGGQQLEDLAHKRVRREMNALMERAPRTANRFKGSLPERVDISAVAPGDRLLVQQGEIVPVDGVLLSASAVLDQSSLTGEALPVMLRRGETLLSGVGNAADPFEMTALRTSGDSTYSGVVRLVAEAQTSKSPIMKMADRYALLFLLLTAAMSALAWFVSGDPNRALAVLVVATPCPLILAVPIAILSGVSRAAKRGVLIKGGEALERLARADTLLLDKTGTLTDGKARLVGIHCFDETDPSTLLRMAASLDQASHHVTAEAIVAAAHDRGLSLGMPEAVREAPGSGVEGMVDGIPVVVGGADLIAARSEDPVRLAHLQSLARSKGVNAVAVMIGGRIAGGLLMSDRIRPEAPTVLRRLRAAGISRIVMLTGDHAELAERVARTLGIEAWLSDLKPRDKIDAVRAEALKGRVIMVGDGVNDAPALAAADVGVAMGARGAAASSEAADVVLLLDRLDRLVTGLQIARRARSIAAQSAIAGIVLSVLAMIAAVAGYLPPISGALLQEAIDVAVILNALRALGGPMGAGRGALSVEQLSEMEAEHRLMADIVDDIRDMADKVAILPPPDLAARLCGLERQLRSRLLRHESEDESELFPRLRGARGAASMFTGLSRSHMEIRRRVNILSALIQALPAEPSDAERRDLQRLLDGLEAITTLHFEEEEEIYRLLEAG